MHMEYDVIIVGARVAGSSLAYEMSQLGYKVLLVDKSTFPSDTLSTHNFFNNSVAMLREMGVLNQLLETGTPLYKRAYIEMDGAVMEGDYPEASGETGCLCIRRTHLDGILFNHAAKQPGVATMQGFRVTELLREDGRDHGPVIGVRGVNKEGNLQSIKAKLVVGADGRRSLVRRLVGAKQLHCVPTDFASYVAYFSEYRQPGEPRVEFYKSGETIAIAFPTSDHLHVVGLMFPLTDLERVEQFKADAEGAFRLLCEEKMANTSLTASLRRANLEGSVKGLLGYDNDWFEGMGEGWALLGDALSFKDPAVGQGMHDALYGSKALSRLLDENRGQWQQAWKPMAEAYRSQMEAKMMSRFALACQFTRNVPITPQQQALNQLIAGSPEATEVFLGIYNYTHEPEALGAVIGKLLQDQVPS
ncbi:monooxygenase [Paenibacillus swuensis]|uniref:Monooxygenase n=1 Tax=Paenibacillus swuensis TaxID=1178515 RepID=A0A172TNF3_9BACL|nr:NAD(P)/FAD-dependent oxidoreductase [Paenibacillus swuensis]ANE48550.1 monooxygenase [Paenibacillus swuensis]